MMQHGSAYSIGTRAQPPAKRPSRMRLYLPFAAFTALLVIYTAYWFVAAAGIRSWAQDWIAQQEAAGYQIEQERIRVTGYPFRFTLEVANPDIAAPSGEGGWAARFERLSATAMPYNFNHWIVAIGGPLFLETGGDTPGLYQVQADDARLSLEGANGRTRAFGLDVAALSVARLQGEPAPISGLERLLVSSVLGDDDELAARIEAREITFTSDQLASEFQAAFGSTANTVRFDGAVTRWSYLASQGDARVWAEAGGELIFAASQLEWGPASLGGEGELTLDSLQRPIGRLSVVIADPDRLVEALVAGGLVQSGQGDALRIAALMAPRRDDGIALPLRLQEGGIFLGPVRLGSLGALD